MILPAAAFAFALLAQAAPAPVPAPPSTPAKPAFGPFWDTLVGEWAGGGSGDPGAGSGRSTFQFELDRNVLVRRSHSDYPAQGDRPDTRHRDLVVISPGATPRDGTATYWDNEGHVIRYVVAWSPDGRLLTFLSAPGEPGPRFRLTYTLTAPGEMAVSFAIAPPGSDSFKEYVGGVLKRAGGRGPA
jgi:hypothetical protein